jgi:glycosyltransferase involved in cell wall biosynthesis
VKKKQINFWGVKLIVHRQTDMTKDKKQRAYIERISELPLYPVDVAKLLNLAQISLDDAGIPYQGNPAGCNPTVVVQYALVQWNKYLATQQEQHYQAFLTQAYWLIEHASSIGEDAVGWPISLPHPDFHTSSLCLSALTQGNSLSVLTRAYQLTSERVFLDVAHYAVRTFERDILDGGVCAPLGEDGVFFEEVSVYPAAHKLSGCIFALIGLYDYVLVTGNAEIKKLIQRGLATLHTFLDEFDVGFWTYSDLLRRYLASSSQLALQVALLEALAQYSGCTHCLTVAFSWRRYQHQFSSRLRCFTSGHCTSYGRRIWGRMRTAMFSGKQDRHQLRVCVPLTGFPVTGGTRTMLESIAQVMKDGWQLEYVTQHVGPYSEEFLIHRFGARRMVPWQFPTVWLYFLAGCRKLIALLHHGASYHIIMPQDGIFTSAFAGVVGKLAGVRVVCIDHGSLTLLNSSVYRAERINSLTSKYRLRRLLEPMLFMCYWPSLYLLARLAARCVDCFLVPGVAGDGVEEICRQLGVPLSRVTRFASAVNIERFVIPDSAAKSSLRQQNGLAADAIVLTMICRFSPEKGIEIALESISWALSTLSPALRERVRVIIAGDGPLRKKVEEDIRRRGLNQTCVLWGEAFAEDVVSLLSISDIFLYTSTRGACFSMAVLEAMASGCAVVASTLPPSNAHLLAEGRGIAVSPGDAEHTAEALVKLINEPDVRRHMGRLARNYIAANHSPQMLRRSMMRATRWCGLDELLMHETKRDAVPVGESES